MKEVDRGKYIDFNRYEDGPQQVGYGATISSPHIHAEMLELLNPFLKPGATALDVGR
jgi:protein-L-isoaspartate(D-aspartate) O-methyltransferase